MTERAEHFYKFGPFRLNPSERLLLRDSKPVPLTQKAFDVLLVLLQNSGHLVEKDQMLKRVWPDTFVEESTLAQNIFIIRKTLGKSRNGHQYVQTVPKRGYRFAEPAIEVGRESADLGGGKHTSERVVTQEREASAHPREVIDSLAVLPLINASADPDMEYLSDGVTESIINNLSQLPQLRLIARSTAFRYKGREIAFQDLGRNLGVRAVVTGIVIHRGDSLSIQAELVDVTDESKLWGQQYTRRLADILTILEELSREITEKLRIRLTAEEKERLTKRCTDNAEAYQLYLKGNYHQNKRTDEGLREALAYFQQALTHDPNFALAYAGLADTYTLGGLPLDPNFALAYAELIDGQSLNGSIPTSRDVMSKAKTAALKALELDDTLAEAHASLGFVRYQLDWDWLGAEREYKRAIELTPNYAPTHHWYSMCLRVMGRLDEAKAEAQRARELDPLLFIVNVELGRIYYFARQYDQAMEHYLSTLEMDANFLPAHFRLGQAYVQKGMYEKAIGEFRKAAPLFENDPVVMAALGHVYAIMGNKGEAGKVLDKLKRLSKLRYVSAYDIALIYAGLGEKDTALEWLHKAYDDRSVRLIGLKVEPMLDSLRSSPYFEDLMRRIGLAP